MGLPLASHTSKKPAIQKTFVNESRDGNAVSRCIPPVTKMCTWGHRPPRHAVQCSLPVVQAAHSRIRPHRCSTFEVQPAASECADASWLLHAAIKTEYKSWCRSRHSAAPTSSTDRSRNNTRAMAHGAARKSVCCSITAIAAPLLLGIFVIMATFMRGLTAGLWQHPPITEPPPIPAEPPPLQKPSTSHTPTWNIDFGEEGEHFEEGMSQLLRIVTGQEEADVARPAAPSREAAAVKQPGHAHGRQRKSVGQQSLPTVATPQAGRRTSAMKAALAQPYQAESDATVHSQRLAERTHNAAADSPAPAAGRRIRAPHVRTTAGKRVPSERCQWLSDTVDDSMRWFLHQERLSISDDQPFPRTW